jgi:electron transfer flavoprotein alpha subunit
MNTILAFSEDLALARELTTCAKSMGTAVRLVAFNERDAQELANSPVEKVHFLKGASRRPEDYAGELAALISKGTPALLLVGDTVSGRELAAKTAALLGAGLSAGINTIRMAG